MSSDPSTFSKGCVKNSKLEWLQFMPLANYVLLQMLYLIIWGVVTWLSVNAIIGNLPDWYSTLDIKYLHVIVMFS